LKLPGRLAALAAPAPSIYARDSIQRRGLAGASKDAGPQLKPIALGRCRGTMLLRANPITLLALILAQGTAVSAIGNAQNPGRPHLLIPGSAFDGEDSTVTRQAWFGVYHTSGARYELKRAIVRIEHAPNGCANTRIVTSDSIPPIFLVSGVTGLRAGPVDTVYRGNRFLYPGEGMSWQLGARWYRLRALGAVSEQPHNTIYSAYELRLGSSENNYETHQTIARLNFADNTPEVRWAGDLDGDGRLDLLLQLPGGGYSVDLRLYLSSLARAPNLVREAGRFYVADC
jgi:hypothetical protein